MSDTPAALLAGLNVALLITLLVRDWGKDTNGSMAQGLGTLLWLAVLLLTSLGMNAVAR